MGILKEGDGAGGKGRKTVIKRSGKQRRKDERLGKQEERCKERKRKTNGPENKKKEKPERTME